MIEALTHHTSAYSEEYIWEMAGGGFTEKFKPKKPEGTRVKRFGRGRSDKETLKRFSNRSNKELWNWQARCRACKVVHQKDDLVGGICESCQAQEI